MVAHPAATALVDQAQAAQRDALSALDDCAERRGWAVRHGALGAGRAAVVTRLRERVTARQVTSCPHLHPARPRRQYWVAWSPGVILCGCCAKGLTPPHGAPWCELCAASLGHVVVMQVPARVDPARLTATGPTTIVTVLCGTCDGA